MAAALLSGGVAALGAAWGALWGAAGAAFLTGVGVVAALGGATGVGDRGRAGSGASVASAGATATPAGAAIGADTAACGADKAVAGADAPSTVATAAEAAASGAEALASGAEAAVTGAADKEMAGVDAATKGLTGVTVVSRQDAWEAGPAIKKADEILKAHPDIDIIFGANEGGTIGAQLAIKNAGKGDKIKVFGTDAAKQEVDMLLAGDGILQAVTGQQPYDMGVKAIIAAVKATRGQAVDKTVVIPGILLTRSKPQDIRTFRAQSSAR